jgi:hypothetical protein
MALDLLGKVALTGASKGSGWRSSGRWRPRA